MRLKANPSPGGILRVVLAGGGTGGHVYPALAMGDALRHRGHEVHVVGAADRLEGRVAPARGYPFHAVDPPRFPRGSLLRQALFALRLGAAVLRARRLLRRIGPDVVLGVGGYIMVPTALAAWTLGVPVVVHEANVAPGLANRLCARVASMVLLTYEATRERLAARVEPIFVGCPVSPELLRADRRAALARYGLCPDRPVVLLVGGSLGAAALNRLGTVLARRPGRAWQLLWITGPAYHAEAVAALDPLPDGVVLLPYEDRMGDAYTVARLAITRAGSSTLAELTALGLPAILVPSPNVTDNHQEANARALEAAAAAEVVVERELDPEAVAGRVEALLADPERLEAMARAAAGLGNLGVAERVADLIEGLVPGA